jgi:hypothetical protein
MRWPELDVQLEDWRLLSVRIDVEPDIIMLHACSRSNSQKSGVIMDAALLA